MPECVEEEGQIADVDAVPGCKLSCAAVWLAAAERCESQQGAFSSSRLRPAWLTTACEAVVAVNSCRYAADGYCDEGIVCDAGTDTADCTGGSCDVHTGCERSFYCSADTGLCHHCNRVTADSCDAIGCATSTQGCVDECCDNAGFLGQYQPEHAEASSDGVAERYTATESHCRALAAAVLGL